VEEEAKLTKQSEHISSNAQLPLPAQLKPGSQLTEKQKADILKVGSGRRGRPPKLDAQGKRITKPVKRPTREESPSSNDERASERWAVPKRGCSWVDIALEQPDDGSRRLMTPRWSALIEFLKTLFFYNGTMEFVGSS